MSFNLRHLKYFVATAELGQVSRAAVELSVSQSAVTAAIKELEGVVGAPSPNLYEEMAREHGGR